MSPANVVTESDRWVTNPDGSKRRRSAYDAPPVEEADSGSATVEYTAPRTHKDADAQAAERGLTFPEGVTTVKAKAEFLKNA